VWRLLTYAFLHDIGWMHIFFNMLFLWFFGREVEDLYGPREFLAFYLTSALLGGIAFMPWALRHVNPLTEHSAVCLGASGAVMACMVLFATHFPHRVIYFWGLFPIPIWLLVLFYVGHDAYVFFVDMQTPTAVTVHLAGAAFGFFYQRNQWRLTRFWPRFSEWRRERSRARLRVYRDEEQITPVRETPTPSAPEMDEQLEAKVDAVLEKVSQHGQESLTDSERELLFRASELYKRRRS
jgi:membrane associated rhomboid family serine protease